MCVRLEVLRQTKGRRPAADLAGFVAAWSTVVVVLLVPAYAGLTMPALKCQHLSGLFPDDIYFNNRKPF